MEDFEVRVPKTEVIARDLRRVIKKVKYNDRMRARLQKVNSKGKSQKTCVYEPQTRKASTKVNKGEEFSKSKPWTKRIALALGRRAKRKVV